MDLFPCQLSSLPSSLAGLLVFFRFCFACSIGLGFGPVLKLSISLFRPGLLLPTLGLRPTCMSVDSEVADITIRIRDLTVSVSGPAAQASQLVSDLVHHHSFGGVGSSAASESGYSLVDLPRSSPASPLQTRDQIEADFPACPSHILLLGKTLRGSAALGGEERIRRAWRAGQWAGAVLQGLVATPNRTTPLDLRSRYYVVLQAAGISEPVCFSTSHSYWRLIRSFQQNEEAVSHSFPSESKAKAYCAGAGVPYPTPQA